MKRPAIATYVVAAALVVSALQRNRIRMPAACFFAPSNPLVGSWMCSFRQIFLGDTYYYVSRTSLCLSLDTPWIAWMARGTSAHISRDNHIMQH